MDKEPKESTLIDVNGDGIPDFNKIVTDDDVDYVPIEYFEPVDDDNEPDFVGERPVDDAHVHYFDDDDIPNEQ